MDLFSEGAAEGFRLEKFELYNWGVFDKKIYSVESLGKSTLLTGENGSGKTTLVDAILTLLVPNQMRFYNQSSGSEHKKDRSEESYVRGAFGNRQSEEALSGQTQYLRSTDTISILCGTFFNGVNGSYVSLMQVRYFTGGSLQRLLCITRQKLSITDINAFLSEKGVSLDRSGKWKKLLADFYGTVFYGDNFKKYSTDFSQIFGLRSDKALKLFSQIVGLKVLGNLTEFIRSNMLEGNNTLEEFDRLRENYTKLIQCDNEIQKTKQQLDMLSPIASTGEKWKKEKQVKSDYESLSDTVPLWFSHNAVRILKEKLDSLNAELRELNAKDESKQNDFRLLENEIKSLEIQLAKNETAGRIKDIDFQLQNLEEEKLRIQNQAASFEKKMQTVGLASPQSESEFNRIKKSLEQKLLSEESKKEKLDGEKFTAQTSLNETLALKESVQKELESLGKRSSNIPEENIRLRKNLCEAIHCEEHDIPFAGELIQVSPDEQDWNYAIEKLLHNFALDMLVGEELYKKVTDYVKRTNLNGRIVYQRCKDSLSLSGGFEAPPDTVPGKIQIKSDSRFAPWIENHVLEHFDFLCTDDTATIARAERALTSTGLIKNKSRHEKDDRKEIRKNFTQVLGWNNTQKKATLSAEYDSLLKEESDLRKKVSILNEKLLGNENIRATLNSLSETESFDSIDVAKRVKAIGSLKAEREKLASSKDIRELQNALDGKNAEKEKLNAEIRVIQRQIGKTEDNILETKKGFDENTSILASTKESLFSSSDSPETGTENRSIELLKKEYPRLSNAGSMEDLRKNRDTMQMEIRSKINGATQRIAGFETSLQNYMNAIKNPSTQLRDRYGDWSAEFQDLGNTKDSLDDYLLFYDRLQKDDLPRYQEQFHEFLHTTVNDDIIDFNQHVQNARQEIVEALQNLNASLRLISYDKNPDTHLQLQWKESTDSRIKEFKEKLKMAMPNAALLAQNSREYEEHLFVQIRTFLDSLNNSALAKEFVLDIRNWFTFAATENYTADGGQKQFYNDSASLSGGEKAKLTYTILASAIAYQFGLNAQKDKSFRFVIIDEAFSKSDAANSEYAMKLFKQLELQTMVVTPLDKINIVEDYISSVHMTENKGTADSRLISMTIEKYRETKEGFYD